ncbi:hypothetical protein Cob_v003875 [Colletotrichum orbiculare MAFF 240422]|uniref:Uncharacterized protein n=1 Tax=Colletotrichum orbiculare (strain 104-T / ATCC 96160 / CBS 514.97 / LARS 414 / MAFF 240422) TaxID=1213857 RepID=A0A484G1L3_COLOR|nr:hypothetical protein Cob_v003875 [Colletotrichum orbiculare MAFF 240422]
MATPITRGPVDDMLSSPDPLNDQVSSALYPSTKRMTRSQRSSRLFSVGSSSKSPRKQTFELEVGDNRAPQRLLVTVEAEGEYEDVGANVGRRLFNSQTPTLRRGATTTTIPLGGDKRVTAVKTPARRGRPPKGSTPGPSGTATRKRAGTPRKTPRPARKPRLGDVDVPESELTIQGTPKSILRRTTRAGSRQLRGSSADPVPSSTRSRGRPKRVDFAPDDSMQPIEDEEEAAISPPHILPSDVAPSDGGLAAGMEEMAVDDPTPSRERNEERIPDIDEDIWMSTVPSPIYLPERRSSSPAYLPEQRSPTPSEQLQSEAGGEPEYGHYDFGPGPASDISSLIGDGDAGNDRRDMDTVAQGEDFSMIFANSIPSLRGNMSIQASGPEDFGEETSLIINRTLESLRQSGALRVDDDEDEVVGIPSEPVEPESQPDLEDTVQQDEFPSSDSQPHMQTFDDITEEVNREPTVDVTGEVNIESIVDLSAVNESPVALPSLPTPTPRVPSASPRRSTPRKSNQSPMRTRSSPRRKSIPLGRRLLESKARQMDDSFSSVPSKILEAATPGKKASRRSSLANVETNEEAFAMDEDDFSEIPDEILEAATPGRHKLPDVEDTVMEEPGAEVEEEDEADFVTEEEPSRASPKSIAPSNASVSFTRSDSGRMLTPDDTPSPNDVPPPESDAKTIEAAMTSPMVGPSSPLAERSRLSQEIAKDDGAEESTQHDNTHEELEEEQYDEPYDMPYEQRSDDEDDQQYDQKLEDDEDMAEEQFGEQHEQHDQAFKDDIEEVAKELYKDTGLDSLRELVADPVQESVGQSVEESVAESAVESVEESIEGYISDRPHEESQVRSQIRSSSLPVGDLTTHLPAAVDEYITPVGPASSPIRSPAPDLLAPRAPSPENSFRPTLSPIVRAGRALQSVTSDASSPPRQNSLGSPFRPTTGSSQPQSAAKSKASWTQPLSNLIQAGAQFFQSPTRQTAQPPAPVSVGKPFDDPFGAENNQVGQPSFMKALAKSMEVSSPVRQLERSASLSGSLRAAPADEVDEMRWMEEQPAPREQPFAPSRSANSSMDVVGESVPSQHASFETQAYDNADETEVEEQNEAEEMEEEDDIWAVEASRPASEASRPVSQSSQPPPMVKIALAPLPARRTSVSSPWRKRSQSPEKPNILTPAAPHSQDSDLDEGEAEDFSMLSQQRSRQKPVPQKPFRMAQQLSGKKDLSAFFSSPALLPGAEGIQDVLENKRRENAFASKGNNAQPSEGVGLQTNSMFPLIPQKAFNPSPSGRSDLFSPVKSSAVEPAPQAPASTRRELFASSRSKAMRHASEVPDSQPPMSDDISFPSVAQKKNFTPRSGQRVNDLFGKPSSSSAAATAPPKPSLTPVRMQLTRADIQKWQEDSASAIAEDSPTSERRSLLRPLPDRNMSPTKSCLRSPMKPRTPGRVVEFTSSVLSPLAQAQVRAERRLSASSHGSSNRPRQQQQQQQQQQRVAGENKENGKTDVSMTDVSRANLPPNPLSQTQWSKDHWLLLDEIVQLRRQGPFSSPWPAGFQSKSGWLLGRHISSHGTSLPMEQWHLDVVDAFKAEVGGWEEEILAKRVFALVVGEKIRKEGPGSHSSVKFF